MVQKHDAAQEQEREAQLQEKTDMERYEKELAAWRVLEQECDERVKTQRARYAKEMKRWNVEKQRAKQEGW